MSDSTLSRRISEFAGVAMFAVALIWLIALVTYEPTDPVWFFTTDAAYPPANFVGRVGAFLSELSFQLFGYASYLLPVVIATVGWHYFWCQPPDAAYTKAFGVTTFFACASAFLSLIFGSTELNRKTFHAGGSIGTWLGEALSEYLNRTGSIIILLTLMVLSVILSTQFSFGRLFARASQESRDLSARGAGWLRRWLDRRRKERERLLVAAKYSKKGSGIGDRIGDRKRSFGSRSRMRRRIVNAWFLSPPDPRSPIPDPQSRGHPSSRAPRRRRCRFPTPHRRKRLPGSKGRSRFHRHRCSMPRRSNGKSTNVN
jgi:DNA segregation ATPase FtsK/SpoIIIE-like protein